MRHLTVSLAAAFAVVIAGATAEAALLGPKPYLGAADSPFAAKTVKDYFHLDDFESDVRTPGYAVSGGSIMSGGAFVDSVDGDDGVLDGLGRAGRSLYADGARSLTFTFDAGTLGRLPTHVGIVWTDVGFTDTVYGFGDVLFEAFDGLGASLGSIHATGLGDGDVHGYTTEDRFFGVRSFAGIGRIEITMRASGDWEVDHVQYGVLTPVPAALPLLATALGGLGWLGHRRRRAA